MRLFVAIGLLAAIAASVLLGLATFGVPVNDSFWLLRAKAPLLDAKLGALGYRVNGHDSRVGVGYDVPDEVGDLSRSVRDFVHTLTLVLVLFPVVCVGVPHGARVYGGDDPRTGDGHTGRGLGRAGRARRYGRLCDSDLPLL